jgi:FkbM family methyltransferase
MSGDYALTKLPVLDDWARAQLTISCRDSEDIPKHPLAGKVEQDTDGRAWQIMHNGLRVEHGGYHGAWMAEIISALRGHHEPQEERAFWEILKRLDGAPTMVEFGAFWAYYSLWFKHDFPNGRCFMYEPDASHSQLGQRNFARNGYSGFFEVAAAGPDGSVDFFNETLGCHQPVKSKSVETVCREQNIDYLDLLHMDIQGFELQALMGAERLIAEGRLRFMVISTHHHLISGDPLTHQKCLQWLIDHDAHVLCEHSVNESYSGDGLIVASFLAKDGDLEIAISHCRQSKSLFRELEFDLAEAAKR